MNELPSGTVTFLFTDIERSTHLWEQHPEEMHAVLARHDSILRDAIESNNGHIIKTTGDGTHAVFERAVDAMLATLTAQRTLQASSSALQFTDSKLEIKVRMGLHTGEAELRAGDYYGQVLNRAARLMSVANGGQILISQITAEVIREHLPAGVGLQDLGKHHLKDLVRTEHIYQLTAADLPQNFPPIKTSKELLNNLPMQLTSFIGREHERKQIRELLHSARLVTLTGSGGTGKTRLAVEIGHEELVHFAHGVWLVELAPLTDGSQMIPTLGQVFGLQEHPFGSLESLVLDYLREKKLLLILDNCEHLINDCARLADDLLHHAAGLKMLASSRESLGIAGEISFRVPSLADSESLRLFVDRATFLNPSFALTDANAASIAQICSRLDGIPLAIELAAARTKLLSAEQIATRLDDRFRLLIGGSRTALPRQQTLRALIDWSYDLLSEEEKSLFRTASVFVGGWTLDALEAVADEPDILEHLEQLVNKSLVATEERGNQMRYFMLETIRQYAREKLFEEKQSSAARDRHFAYYDQLAGHIWDIFRTEDTLVWRDQANDEIENLRAAVEWGLENHVEDAIRLAANFCLIGGWMGSHLDDCLRLCRAAIKGVRILPSVSVQADIERQKSVAKALFVLGLIGMSSGNVPLVLQDLQDAIATARAVDDKLILGYSLEMFFVAAAFISVPGTREAAEEGFRIFREEIHDNWGLSMAYQNKARLAAIDGDQVAQEEYFVKFRELIQQTPLSIQAGLFYLGLGSNEKMLGNYEKASSFFEEGLDIFIKVRSKNFQLVMKSELAHVARLTGRITEAKISYRETLRGWQNMGHRGAIAHQLECFAFIGMIEEEPQCAAKLLGAAEALRERAASPMSDFETTEYEAQIIRLRSMLTERELRSLWADGRALALEEAIALALGTV